MNRNHLPPYWRQSLSGDADAQIESMQYMQSLGDAGTQAAFNYGDTDITTLPVAPPSAGFMGLTDMQWIAIGVAVGILFGPQLFGGGRR